MALRRYQQDQLSQQLSNAATRTLQGLQLSQGMPVWSLTMIEDLTSARYPGVFADLADGSLLRLEEGERLWKLYFLRPAWGREERIEHRIYTKEQASGALALVSYNFSMPPGSQPSKSGLAFARDIPKDMLNQVIWNVVRKSQIGPDEFEVVDLSGHATYEKQVVHLRGLGGEDERYPADTETA